jgi:sec-independent protein translocase protein TatB
MFDFDAGKLLVIGVVALIVIGPKDLPRVLRQLGQTVAKLRRMATEFQSQFMDAMREAELDDIRQDMSKLTEQTRIKSTFNPLETVRRELTDAMSERPPEAVIGAPALELEGLDHVAKTAEPDFAAGGGAPIAEAAPSPTSAEPPGSSDPKPAADEPMRDDAVEPAAARGSVGI